MKILRIETAAIRLPLGEPYSIAYGSYDFAEMVLARIVTDTQHVGLGCAAPDPEVTGEDVLSVIEKLEKSWGFLKDVGIENQEFLFGNISEIFSESPAAGACLEMAIWDLLGKKSGLPVFKLLGAKIREIKTYVTIGICDVEATIGKAEYWFSEGFRKFKIKGGQDVEEDILRIEKLRGIYGPEMSIGFDANQGYDLSTAKYFARSTKKTTIDFFEQPLAKKNIKDMRALKDEFDHIIADEPITTPASLESFLVEPFASLINIKLMKCGGISAGRVMAQKVAEVGMDFMMGCMDEVALSINAAIALTLSSPNCRFVDLDGSIGLKKDPSTIAVTLSNGRLLPSQNPGLGVKDWSI